LDRFKKNNGFTFGYAFGRYPLISNHFPQISKEHNSSPGPADYENNKYH